MPTPPDRSGSNSATPTSSSVARPEMDVNNATPEMLAEAERELMELISRKKVVDKQLLELERKIFALETSYLDDTPYGNIIRGFDGYTNSRTDKKRSYLNEADRLFSLSSATWQKALEEKNRPNDREQSEEASNHHASSPAGINLSKSNSSLKKIKKKRSSVGFGLLAGGGGGGGDDSGPGTPVSLQRRKKQKIIDDDDE
ncbi:Chromatin modification- protein meaf6 [Rhizophlyctis rosea]|uniref:Chromatin modification-related protein EAF6 n=1 Tax=Rhizophlyctis rosea TaxID=64517 RepID=A0AAD5X752_9FUNG|nr:Chromatin modification- protein meaf6 [Rhizophlyctis rosea]